MPLDRLVIDCLRHGACTGPSSLRGRSDMALSSAGEAQMAHALRHLEQPQRLVTSPLQRCRDSAEQFASHWRLALEVDECLTEMDFGDWDGVALETLHQQYPEQLACFWQDPYRFPPPGAEPVATFTARCRKAWQALLDPPAQHTLVVTHAGVIKCWIAAALGLEMLSTSFLAALGVDYAHLVRFEVTRDESGQSWSRLVYLGPSGGAP